MVTDTMDKQCPELQKLKAGDEIYFKCEWLDRPCIREYGNYECTEYDNWLKEESDES